MLSRPGKNESQPVGRWAFPWHRLPKLELGALFKTDFFPPPPSDLGGAAQICIGTKTRTIGDALILSTLPRLLKNKYPDLEIRVFPRAFNPTVFYANPFVSGLNYMPRTLYGDDINVGLGHLVTLKEQYFDFAPSSPPRPEIYLTQTEEAWAKTQISGRQNSETQKPLCILHPWGHTWQNITSLELWTDIVKTHSATHRFWQVGIQGHAQIPGCERWLLSPRAFRYARKLFSVIKHSDFFIGINSGPMHIARAFDRPSLILTAQGNVSEIFEKRRAYPYFLYRNWANGFLYEDNIHLDVPLLPPAQIIKSVNAFLSQ